MHTLGGHSLLSQPKNCCRSAQNFDSREISEAEIAQLMERPTKKPGIMLMQTWVSDAAISEAKIAQLVEHPTEKLGIMLMQIWVLDAPRDFSPRVSVQCRHFCCLYSPLCAVACIDICVHVKNPKHWQPYHFLDTWRYCTHWQEWVALPLWLQCLTQVRPPKFPTRDKEGLKIYMDKHSGCQARIGHMSCGDSACGFQEWALVLSLVYQLL